MIHNLASSKTIGVGDARMSLSYAQSHEYVVSMWINDLHVRDLTTHDNVNAALASARSIEMYYGIGGEGLAKVHIFNFAYSKPVLRSVHGKWRDATPQEIRALNLTKRLIIARPFGQTSLGWIRVKAYAQLVIPKGVELTAQALEKSCHDQELVASLDTLAPAMMVHGLGIEHGMKLEDLRCESQGRHVVFSGDVRLALFQSFGRHTSFHDVNDLLSFDAGRKAIMGILTLRSCAMKLNFRGHVRAPDSATAEPLAMQLPVIRWEIRAGDDIQEEQLDGQLHETLRI